MPRLRHKSTDQKSASVTSRKQRARSDPGFREQERVTDAVSKRKAREDHEYRDKERSLNAESMRRVRENPNYREHERVADAEAKRKARKDPERQQKERETNVTYKRKEREREEFRSAERLTDSARKRRKVENAGPSATGKLTRTRLFQSDYDRLLQSFQECIHCFPDVTCSCCGCLWYEDSTVATSREKLHEAGLSEETICKILWVNLESPRLCKTCKTYVSGKGGRSRIPKLALSNGFQFPDIPDVLMDLSPLEERLVAARIPFMQVRVRGPEQQSAIRGNVINVQNDLILCTESIPRPFNKTGTVQIKFMRRMSYQIPYMEERIRPWKVYQAAKYLVSTPLYQQEGILICNEWQTRTQDEEESFICGDTETDCDACCSEEDPGDDMNIAEPQDPNPINDSHAPEESLLFLENEVQFRGIKIAPGEENRPIPFFMDKRAKELSFPKISGGQISEYGVRVTFTDIAKSEIRRFDRRACHATYIFWLFKKLLSERISNAAQTAIRQRSGLAKLTAENARSSEYLKRLIERDDGYAIFKNIRSSPCYWKQQQKRVLGMIRQLGKPTFYITVSAAETRWPELLQMLHKIVKNEEISATEAAQLPFHTRAELIRSDPVTCMQNYNHRFRSLVSKLLKPKEGIFSPFELTDYFTRVEFQMRGSPHTHGIFWLKNAPVYEEGCEDSAKKCIEFVDEFITCKRDEEGEMKKVLSYQLHDHSQTCYKRNRTKKVCRFGFPKPPMPSTIILTPLDRREEDKAIFDKCQENYKSIQLKLISWGKNFRENMGFGDYLCSLGLTLEEYILAVRSSIRNTTVFLKRQTSEIFINGYNKKLLMAWKANIDFQFILDPYACAKYCVGYITKSEGGVSKLLHAVAEEVRTGNLTVREQLKQFARVLNHGSEVSAQEAVAFILGLPNTMCSVADVFINTSEPLKRIGMLKSAEELALLDDDSDDVLVKGLLDHYANRPRELKKLCLADFAAQYEFVRLRHPKSNLEEVAPEGDGVPELDAINEPAAEQSVSNEITMADVTPSLMLRDKTGYLREREKRKIIRFCNFNKDTDYSNYCRERIMLFLPWENEEEDLLSIHPPTVFERNQVLIRKNARPYFFYSDDQHIRIVSYLSMMAESDVDEEDFCELENNQELQDDEDAMCAEFDSHRSREKVQNFRPPKIVDDAEYLKLMRSLNDKQRRFVLHTMSQLKSSKQPLYYFLSGGAGVGKSHVVHAIVQSCLRKDFQRPSEYPNQSPVIVCAPTGKAAFNVMGMTLHCTFKLPPNQSKQFSDLNPSSLNTLRMQLSNVQLFIIDEISMTSQAQLDQINRRLQQVFGNNEYFGGRSVIVVGHLRQLPPVMASFPFEPPNTDTGDIAGKAMWELFTLYELDEIMRQRGQHAFCQALNNMAEGVMTKSDIALIRSREITPQNQPPQNAFRLFQSNEQCIEFNEQYHDSLDSDGGWAIAYDRVVGKHVTQEQTEHYAENAKTFKASDAEGLPYRTHLQVGAVYKH